jgi:hypothetical protein
VTAVTSVGEVFKAIEGVKAGASAFCTNFYPVETKLEAWIEHGDLAADAGADAVFFYRKDRGFWRLHFCARDVSALERALLASSRLKAERLVIDLVGKAGALDSLINVIQSTGFRPLRKLLRLARGKENGFVQAIASDIQVTFADQGDAPRILRLLESSFDCYADQLPTPYELEQALSERQVLAIKSGGDLAAMLFFETRGLTSTVRFWAVATPFRCRRFGAASMRYYFALNSVVQRFILWVTETNDTALDRYRHYGYVPDGLIDQVMVSPAILT